jgi:mobilization protein NikA
VDDKERRMITFQVSGQELEMIEARAAEAGLSRSEYIRARALSEPAEHSYNYLADLIKHGIYLANQAIVAQYSIAQAEGKHNRFLSYDEIREVYKRVNVEAIQYALEFPEEFVQVQELIEAERKAETSGGPATVQKGT